MIRKALSKVARSVNFLTAFLLTLLPYITCSAVEDPFENPIFDDTLFSYFIARPRARVDIFVQDATGKGEKALDFFVVEDKRIPRNLNEIAHSTVKCTRGHIRDEPRDSLQWCFKV